MGKRFPTGGNHDVRGELVHKKNLRQFRNAVSVNFDGNELSVDSFLNDWRFKSAFFQLFTPQTVVRVKMQKKRFSLFEGNLMRGLKLAVPPNFRKRGGWCE